MIVPAIYQIVVYGTVERAFKRKPRYGSIAAFLKGNFVVPLEKGEAGGLPSAMQLPRELL
ncbi:MAG: hypothetical protein HZB37_12935 [Planctomycetes bacterium]|nr:hypothetical protein [Planctomycetota bacterium]